MTQPTSSLAHSHSALIFRMDELDAHAQGLAEASDDLAPLIDALHESFSLFNSDMLAHIAHEEGFVFVEAQRGGLSASDVQVLVGEHRALCAGLEQLREQIEQLNVATPSAQRASLVRSIAALRNTFVHHSITEHSLLGVPDHFSCQTP